MSFEEKMKQDLKKDLEIPEIVEQKIQDAYKEIGQGKLRMKKPITGIRRESVDSSGGSCGGDRCIRNGSLFQSGTGEEYPGDRRCLCKNAGKQGEGSVCRER